MSKFVMPITTAVLLFPLIAALITAPFLIYKYRKVGAFRGFMPRRCTRSCST